MSYVLHGHIHSTDTCQDKVYKFGRYMTKCKEEYLEAEDIIKEYENDVKHKFYIDILGDPYLSPNYWCSEYEPSITISNIGSVPISIKLSK